MRQQDLETMYGWIEENYGDAAGEEGSDTWDEAVQSYEDYCEYYYQLEDELLYKHQELEWYIYIPNPKLEFLKNKYKVLKLFLRLMFLLKQNLAY